MQASQKYLDRFQHIDDRLRRVYAAMVSAVDDGVEEFSALSMSSISTKRRSSSSSPTMAAPLITGPEIRPYGPTKEPFMKLACACPSPFDGPGRFPPESTMTIR